MIANDNKKNNHNTGFNNILSVTKLCNFPAKEEIYHKTVINSNIRLHVAVLYSHSIIIPSITNLYLHYTPSVTLYNIHPSVTIIFKIHIITP